MRIKSKIRLAGLSSPQDILINFSSPVLWLGADLVILPLVLLVACKMNRALPFVCLFGAVLISTALMIYRPPNPFSIGELWGQRFDMKQLEVPARCVLTFLKSKQARKIALEISAVLMLVIAGAWYVSSFVLKGPPFHDTVESIWTGSLGMGFLLAVVVFTNQYGLLFRYTLKHWDTIQKVYKPWPITEQFELPLKDIWKPVAWERSA